MRESIETRTGGELGRTETLRAPAPAATPVATTTTRQSREDDADRQNWIFRDTQSAAGVRKALGVDSGEQELPTMTERDSVAVIQEYFSREKARSVSAPDAFSSRSDRTGFGAANSQGGLGQSPAAGGLVAPGNQQSGNLFGESAFRNTLNSDNNVVRRYFRDLYISPGAGVPTATQSDPLPNQPPSLAGRASMPAIDVTRPPSFQDLANRAAFIDSLTPATTLSPQFGVPQINNPPVLNSQSAPTVNNGKLFERRNGVIEIPSRRF